MLKGACWKSNKWDIRINKASSLIPLYVIPCLIIILYTIAVAFSPYISAAEGVTTITAPSPPPTQHTGRKRNPLP